MLKKQDSDFLTKEIQARFRPRDAQRRSFSCNGTRIGRGQVVPSRTRTLEGVGTAHGLAEARHWSGLILPPPRRCDRVPSFSSLSIAARVDRTSADPGTYVSKPPRHLVSQNTPSVIYHAIDRGFERTESLYPSFVVKVSNNCWHLTWIYFSP